MKKSEKVFISCIDVIMWVLIKINTITLPVWIQLGKFNKKMGFKK